MEASKHPRHETQQDRDQAYRILRNRITRNLYEHGVPSMIIGLDPSVSISGTERQFFNPERNQTFSLNRTINNGEIQLVIDIDDLDEATGSMKNTQYLCAGKEAFKRNDFSAAMQRPGETGKERNLRIMHNMASNLGVIETGLTGHPITAKEANDLIALLEGAVPIEDPLGRTSGQA